jgi:uncharacterized cupin superfamily protein
MHVVVQHLSDEEKKNLGIYDWPIWTKEISIFDWQYDSREECFILEGEVEIIAADGEKTSFKAGDFVTFPKGLTCTWIVKQAVRKHYRFQ